MEGDTDDPAILQLRRRLMRNAFAVLMVSRGTPMFLAGDEFCNTQFGNNNAYCQDNEISWLDWNLLQKNQEMFEFFSFMIHFRKAHAVIRKNTEPCSMDFPAISHHGINPWVADYQWNCHMIGIMFAGKNPEDGEDDVVYLSVNSYWEPQTVDLPALPENKQWKVVIDTFYETGRPEQDEVGHNHITLQPRSVQVLVVEDK